MMVYAVVYVVVYAVVYEVVYVVACAAATVCSFSARAVDCVRHELCVWSPVGCLVDNKRRYSM